MLDESGIAFMTPPNYRDENKAWVNCPRFWPSLFVVIVARFCKIAMKIRMAAYPPSRIFVVCGPDFVEDPDAPTRRGVGIKIGLIVLKELRCKYPLTKMPRICAMT